MQQYFTIFDADQELLSTLVNGGDEEVLKLKILQHISCWAVEYTLLFCEKPWKVQEELTADLSFQRQAEKLWQVWKHHFETAVELFKKRSESIDLFELARQVEQGKGYLGKGGLGGNPFRDILLVDSIIEKDPKAQSFFYEEYQGIAVHVVREESEREDWWSDFCRTHVLEVKKKNNLPAISNYHGRSGLSKWVNRSAIRFHSAWRKQKSGKGIYLTEGNRLDICLEVCTEEEKEKYHHHFQINNNKRQSNLSKPRERLKWLLNNISERSQLVYQKEVELKSNINEYPDGTALDDKTSHPKNTNSSDQLWSQCAKMLGSIVKKLMGSLSDEDRLIVELYLFEGLTLEQIGKIIGKNKGTTQRRLKKLTDRLFEGLACVVSTENDEQDEYEKCRQLLKLPAFTKDVIEWLKNEIEKDRDFDQDDNTNKGE